MSLQYNQLPIYDGAMFYAIMPDNPEGADFPTLPQGQMLVCLETNLGPGYLIFGNDLQYKQFRWQAAVAGIELIHLRDVDPKWKAAFLHRKWKEQFDKEWQCLI